MMIETGTDIIAAGFITDNDIGEPEYIAVRADIIRCDGALELGHVTAEAAAEGFGNTVDGHAEVGKRYRECGIGSSEGQNTVHLQRCDAIVITQISERHAEVH